MYHYHGEAGWKKKKQNSMKTLFPALFSILIISSCSAQTDHPISIEKGKIVFSSERNGNAEIFTMNSDGTNLKQLTNHPSRDAWPKWSPDGKQIIFCSERKGKNKIINS